MSEQTHRLVHLAARAKTKVETQGMRGLTNLSQDEVFAMAFVCDLFLEDYEGPLTRGEPVTTPNPKTEQETP